jgi:hydrogenase maturation protease
VKQILILGYGNADRQDDGVAWHVLNHIAKHLHRPLSNTPDDGFDPSEGPVELLFALQLTPEMAETVAGFERVCFVDAHTGAVPNEINIVPVGQKYESSPFTHHMTPATCLSLAKALYGYSPESLLVSVRGYEFGFGWNLSPRTQVLAAQAANQIVEWLGSGQEVEREGLRANSSKKDMTIDTGDEIPRTIR